MWNLQVGTNLKLCGYESIARDVKAEFCSLFTDDEWLDVEYYFDVRRRSVNGR
jgi:hypothetical protein